MAGTAQPLGATSTRRYQLFIDGKFVDSRSGKTFESINPHDRSVMAVVAEGDKADIDAAVVAARAAYEGAWSSMLPGERAKILNRMADLLEARAMDLGQLETLDLGGPIFLTSGMAMMGPEVFRCR
jgi:aldehyde dehydrogenase (NAD+)